jgi:diguanylate cyclase (GGDEF)-like protein/PAS domain S-box-containing protein
VSLHDVVDTLLRQQDKSLLVGALFEQMNALILSTYTQIALQAYQIQTHAHDVSLEQFHEELSLILEQLKTELTDRELSTLTDNLKRVEAALFSEGGLLQLHQAQHQLQQVTEQKQYSAVDTMTRLNGDVNALLAFANRSAFKQSLSQFANAKYAHSVLMLLSILMSIVIVVLAMFIYVLLERPIAQLKMAFSALSQGALDTRLPESGSHNELLMLSQDFNFFAESTEALFNQVKESQLITARKEAYLSALLRGVPEVILTLDEMGQVEAYNPAARRVLAIDTDPQSETGMHIHQFLHEDLHFAHVTALAEYLEESDEDIQAYRLNGEPIYVRLSVNKLESDEHRHWVCVITDVTQWRYTDAQFKQLTVELNAILENAIIGIAYVQDRKFLRVNRRFETLFGYQRDEVSQQSTDILFLNDSAFEQIGEQAYATMATGESFSAQIELVKQNGSKFWCSVSGNAIDPQRPNEGSIWLFEDVTLQRENEEYLIRLASIDPLTGLLNRTVFNDRIAHAIHKAERQAGQVAVCFIDLDHFKHVNDSLGHKAGDVLLKEVAARLKANLREGDSVARLGGDEFALLLEDISSVKDVARIVDKVMLALAQPCEIEAKEVSVSPSIGISLYPSDG